VPGVSPKKRQKISDYSAVAGSPSEPAVPAYRITGCGRSRPQVLGLDPNGSKPTALASVSAPRFIPRAVRDELKPERRPTAP